MANYMGMELPKHVHVKRRYNLVEITYGWFRLSNIFISILVAVLAYSGLYFSDAPLLIWIVIAIFLVYFALAGCVNTTKILITEQQIIVSYSPLPWPGVKKIDVKDIKQLYSLKKKSFSASGYSVLFVVYIVPHVGEDIQLTEGFAESKQSLYVRQEIEKYLGIDNKDWLVREMLE